MENIKRARETIEFFHSLDSRHLCTIGKGQDLLESVQQVFDEAEKIGIKVKYDTVQLMNRIRDEIPEKNRSRYVRNPIEVYIKDDGDLYFEWRFLLAIPLLLFFSHMYEAWIYGYFCVPVYLTVIS